MWDTASASCNTKVSSWSREFQEIAISAGDLISEGQTPMVSKEGISKSNSSTEGLISGYAAHKETDGSKKDVPVSGVS